MFNNEYLNKCLEEKQGNATLLYGYKFSVENNINQLIIKNFSFYYDEEVEHFKKEIIKAKLNYFILADDGSGLMNGLHQLDKFGFKINGTEKIEYLNKWSELNQIQGLKIVIE